mmetsp:Transcript_127106/g.359766  ORF Transcript_127106/g.359766 Transcript_127106/m.359766 type:complete len:389 (+) Transcript_127106:445-1611(+)
MSLGTDGALAPSSSAEVRLRSMQLRSARRPMTKSCDRAASLVSLDHARQFLGVVPNDRGLGVHIDALMCAAVLTSSEATEQVVHEPPPLPVVEEPNVMSRSRAGFDASLLPARGERGGASGASRCFLLLCVGSMYLCVVGLLPGERPSPCPFCACFSAAAAAPQLPSPVMKVPPTSPGWDLCPASPAGAPSEAVAAASLPAGAGSSSVAASSASRSNSSRAPLLGHPVSACPGRGPPCMLAASGPRGCIPHSCRVCPAAHAPGLTYVRPQVGAGMSHCPSKFQPHATACPSLRSSTVWRCPAAACKYTRPRGRLGTLHWPLSLLPKATASPSLRRSTTWFPPPATSTKRAPSGGVGTSGMPNSMLPTRTASPSLLRSAVKRPPAPTFA